MSDTSPEDVSGEIDATRLQHDGLLTLQGAGITQHVVRAPHIVSVALTAIYSDGTVEHHGATARDSDGLRVRIDNAVTPFTPHKGG